MMTNHVMLVMLSVLMTYSDAVCEVTNCAECNGNSPCDLCNDGYWLESGACKQCHSHCSRCHDTSQCQYCVISYWNIGQNISVMMSTAALIILLYTLPVYSDAVCQVINCADCNGNSSCDLCNDGYWLASGACKQCPSHCSRCPDTSQCQSCVISYWNIGHMCNLTCSVNCTDSGCEDTNGYCKECKPGKYDPLCDQDCSLCINGECDLRKCTYGCKDGYVQYNTDTHSYCMTCSSNCIHCSNASFCTQCELGFYRNYYRYPTSGRGTAQCTQCWEQCTQCISNNKCPEECKSACIKQACDVSGVCVTTRSTSSTICSSKCKDNCDVRGKCHTTTTSNNKLQDAYYDGFGHGTATGIGILFVVGKSIGVVIFFTRRTNCLHKLCPTKSSSYSRENHVYVNTQEDTGTMPTSRRRPLHNEVNTNSEIHVTLSEEDVDTNKEYVSLGERQSENHYSDLQTNRRDDQ